jgi:hypothetical protein
MDFTQSPPYRILFTHRLEPYLNQSLHNIEIGLDRGFPHICDRRITSPMARCVPSLRLHWQGTPLPQAGGGWAFSGSDALPSPVFGEMGSTDGVDAFEMKKERNRECAARGSLRCGEQK